MLLGFITVLLVAIPITTWLISQQQQTKSNAEKSTVLSFSPDSTQSTPIIKNVGDSIPLDLMINPGVNLVTYAKIEIQYDPAKLATDSAAPFTPNTSVFPTILEGPIYLPGKIDISLSIGSDPTKAIQTLAKIGTITLDSIAATDPNTPTQVIYTTVTQVLSLGSNDQASEDVLSSVNPAFIAISNNTVTGTPTMTPTETPTQIPTQTPTPTTSTTTTTTTTTSSGPTVSCNVMSASPSASGVAPFTATFTVSGSSATAANINKATFNFGDGGLEDVTNGGGIGTTTITNVQANHVYNSAGTYNATAILTDTNGNTSTPTSCALAITVSAASGGTTTTTVASTATPTLAPTGPGDTFVNSGIFLTIITIVGGVLFFAL